jgi:hypothetical protein
VQWQRCIQDVQTRAIRKVNRPAVTAAFPGQPDVKAFAQASAAR